MARIALALGSGGARGYAHIGIIRALQQRGHEIVAVAGSSMGALVGGAFAAGELDTFSAWACALSRGEVLRQLDPSRSSTGVLRAERMLTRMADFVGGRRIEELPIPFTAVAVDLLAGQEVWLDAGPLDRAIRASIGIPGLFTPTVLNGRLFVDGGVLDPVPVAAAAAARADAVVAVSLHGEAETATAESPAQETADRRPPAEWWARFRANLEQATDSDPFAAIARHLHAGPAEPAADGGDSLVAEASLPKVNLVDVLRLSLAAAEQALSSHLLATYPPGVLITVPTSACRTMEFHRAAELIELGQRLAEESTQLARLE